MAVYIVQGPCYIEAMRPDRAGHLWTTQLGYPRDGVELRIEPRHAPVFCDALGGTTGPPIDLLFLGATATARFELSKYDAVGVQFAQLDFGGSAAVRPDESFGLAVPPHSVQAYGQTLLRISFTRGSYSMLEIGRGAFTSVREIRYGARASSVRLEFTGLLYNNRILQLFAR